MEVTHKGLQAATKDINTVFELSPKLNIITNRPALEKGIKDTLGGFAEAQDDRIDDLKPETIGIFNHLIQPDAVAEVAAEMAEEDAQAEANLETAPAGEGDEECPVFGQEFDPSAPECTECARAEECAPLTQAAKQPEAKPKKTAKEKPTKETQTKGRYGARLGTMTSTLDDLLWEGTTKDGAAAILMKKYGRTEVLAARKFSAHVAYLKKEKGLTITITDGVYKASEETI